MNSKARQENISFTHIDGIHLRFKVKWGKELIYTLTEHEKKSNFSLSYIKHERADNP